MTPVSDVVRTELERIASNNDGRLTASGVLAVAKRTSHPLHDHFEWDDSAAAHAHRLWQARQLIKSVYTRPADDSPPAPVFVHIRQVEQGAGREGYYAPVADLNRDEWQIAMADASRRVAQAQASVNVLLTHAKTSKRKSLVRAASKHLEKASSELVSIGV